MKAMSGALLAIMTFTWSWCGVFSECNTEDQMEETCQLQTQRAPASLRTESAAAGHRQREVGIQIPLSIYPFNPDADGPTSPAVTIDVSPILPTGEVLPAQRVLFDTGSAGLALCNKSFHDLLSTSRVPGLVPCKSYGGPGNWVAGYWGRVYKGSLYMDGVSISDTHYSVMEQDIGMPCNVHGFMGIFGSAFTSNYKLWETTQEITEPLWSAGEVQECQASIPGVTGETTKTPPLEQLSTELAGGAVNRVGIYWNGQVGPSVGTLYLGSTAISNPHYVRSQVLRARWEQGLNGHYNVFVKSMTAGGIKFTGFPCNSDDLSQFCILDTGSSAMTIPQEVSDAIGTGSLQVELEGVSSEQPTITLEFDISAMKQMEEEPVEGVPVPVNESFVMLGLPTWAFYYTVFSSDSTLDFVPMTPQCCSFDSGNTCGGCGPDASAWCHGSAKKCEHCGGKYTSGMPPVCPGYCCSYDGGYECGDCGSDHTGWCHEATAHCDHCGGKYIPGGNPECSMFAKKSGKTAAANSTKAAAPTN
mmetsp:Transcript_55307/g.177321  ORF Transcript_55307/g.177321 Transcript_55307/m.177321 type:complete len:530 (-) Transcript_55307:83-1672(-)